MNETKEKDVTEVKGTTAVIFVGMVAGISCLVGYRAGYKHAVKCISDVLTNSMTSTNR